jgi:hypothetical protein
VVGSFEHCNSQSGSLQLLEILDRMRDSHVLKEDVPLN